MRLGRLGARLAVGVAALAMVAVACGDDDAAPATTAAAPITTAAPAPTEAPQDLDIVETAIAAGDFTTLVAALEAAGLTETLQGAGPFTVFAPTDAAFAALPEGALQGLLGDIPALTDVLLYHVVPGEVLAADVVSLQTATTVQGSDLGISAESGNVTVGGATVVATDITTSNGVIHVIDAVLLP